MAKPNFSKALSICCGNAPTSSSSSICLKYVFIMRLPMNPSHTPATTPTFLICLDMARAVASTSLAVLAPRTISSSLLTLAGLKKCRPITSCGRRVKSAILFRSSVEVFDARIAPLFAT